jgi:hypothetical protein
MIIKKKVLMRKTFSTKNFWIGLLVIFIIYTTYWILLAENKRALAIPVMYRHILKMCIVFAVYFAGTFFLRTLPQKWLIQLWHFIHITLISILLFLWFWHFGVKGLPLYFRRLGFSIHEFLISPLLYLATGILGWVGSKSES